MTLDPRWIDGYRRDLNHKIRLEAIREDGARKIKQIREDAAAIRRLEESGDALEIKHFYKLSLIRHKMPVAVARNYLDLLHDQQGIIVPEDRPHVDVWRADIEKDATRMGVTISWVQECAGLNAYAWTTLKRIEIAPPTSAGLYATAKHELGHHARPCVPDHRRVTTGKKTCCVRCELAAWQWAIAHSQPTWSRSMHDRLRRSLLTYRRHGTPDEQVEIDDLVSDVAFYRARLARLTQ